MKSTPESNGAPADGGAPKLRDVQFGDVVESEIELGLLQCRNTAILSPENDKCPVSGPIDDVLNREIMDKSGEQSWRAADPCHGS